MTHVERKLAAARQLVAESRMPLAYTTDEVARLLKIRRTRARWLVSTWRIRSVAFAGRRYVTSTEVARQLRLKAA